MARSLLYRIKRGLLLSGADRRMLLGALVSLALVHVRLRTHGLQWVIARLPPATAPASQEPSPDQLCRARRCAYWIEVAARHHVLRPNCLVRSLTLHRWLRDEGIPSELRIGLRKVGDEPKGHAWIVLGGHVVNDPPNAVAEFTPLVSPGAKLTAWSTPPETDPHDLRQSVGVRG
jgi:Transglutaminase-like superfamily